MLEHKKMRRVREEETIQHKQPQLLQQPPPVDRVDVIFNSLCSMYAEKFFRAAPDQAGDELTGTNAAATMNIMTKQEQTKLKRLFSEFLAGVNDTSRFANNNNNDGQEGGFLPGTSAHEQRLQFWFAALDEILADGKTFLRGVMLNKLEKQKLPSSDSDAMLLSVAQSSAGTTAASTDDNNINSSAASASASSSGVKSNNTAGGGVIAVPTFEADAFLFDDEDIDDFEANGWLSRHFCANCGRADAVLKTSFISHSFPVPSLKFLCAAMLDKAVRAFERSTAATATGSAASATTTTMTTTAAAAAQQQQQQQPQFVAVDVGSRLGIVPLAMSQWLLSHNKHGNIAVHGVEMDSDYCSIQRRLLNCKILKRKKNVLSRILVTETDVTAKQGTDLLSKANFVVMNNVFEFFSQQQQRQQGAASSSSADDDVDPEAPTLELRAWRTVLQSMPIGCHLVLIPGMDASLSAARKRVDTAAAASVAAAAAVVVGASAKPKWEIRWQQIPIDASEMRKIAKMCTVVDDEEDDDDDEKEHAHDHHGDGADVHQHGHGGCSGGACGHSHGKKKKTEIDELVEDFSEISLYVAVE